MQERHNFSLRTELYYLSTLIVKWSLSQIKEILQYPLWLPLIISFLLEKRNLLHIN